MSYALVEDIAASWDSYEHFGAQLEHTLPDGLILHAAGRTDEGIRIIEVWDSEEAWQRFALDRQRRVRGLLTATCYRRHLTPTRLLLGRIPT